MDPGNMNIHLTYTFTFFSFEVDIRIHRHTNNRGREQNTNEQEQDSMTSPFFFQSRIIFGSWIDCAPRVIPSIQTHGEFYLPSLCYCTHQNRTDFICFMIDVMYCRSVSLRIGCTRLRWCSHILCVALCRPFTIFCRHVVFFFGLESTS